jgi:hypothetical protein
MCGPGLAPHITMVLIQCVYSGPLLALPKPEPSQRLAPGRLAWVKQRYQAAPAGCCCCCCCCHGHAAAAGHSPAGSWAACSSCCRHIRSCCRCRRRSSRCCRCCSRALEPLRRWRLQRWQQRLRPALLQQLQLLCCTARLHGGPAPLAPGPEIWLCLSPGRRPGPWLHLLLHLVLHLVLQRCRAH